MIVLNSHHIAEIIPFGRDLLVRFKGGEVYRHRGVPPEVFVELERAEKEGRSVGTLYDRLVKKPGYRTERVR